MPNHAITPRGDMIVTNEGTIIIDRKEPHFRWEKIDGKLTFQQLHATRNLTANVWRGHWQTIWTNRK